MQSDKEYYVYQNFFWESIVAIVVDQKKSLAVSCMRKQKYSKEHSKCQLTVEF